MKNYIMTIMIIILVMYVKKIDCDKLHKYLKGKSLQND